MGERRLSGNRRPMRGSISRREYGAAHASSAASQLKTKPLAPAAACRHHVAFAEFASPSLNAQFQFPPCQRLQRLKQRDSCRGADDVAAPASYKHSALPYELLSNTYIVHPFGARPWRTHGPTIPPSRKILMPIVISRTNTYIVCPRFLAPPPCPLGVDDCGY